MVGATLAACDSVRVVFLDAALVVFLHRLGPRCQFLFCRVAVPRRLCCTWVRGYSPEVVLKDSVVEAGA